MSQKNKILIIKHGYSETFEKQVSEITSLGDVLRTTVLLHLYKEQHVTWLTDAKAAPLLYGNPYIDKLLLYNMTSMFQLEAEHFDVVINLEKVPGICAFTDKIHAWKKLGYRFNPLTGEAEAYDRAEDALKISKDPDHKKHHGKTWQEALFEMVGATWKGESYVLGYKPQVKKKFDLGFNYEVGTKWSIKAWPRQNWDVLARELSEYSITFQQGKSNIYEYIDWIASCRVLVSNDSLGLHIALALGIPVIGMFGPTPYSEVADYGLGYFLKPDEKLFPCMPCLDSECHNSSFCMSTLKVETVVEAVRSVMLGSPAGRYK